MINFHCCSDIFDFHLCADDANLFYKSESRSILEKKTNAALNNIRIWLCTKLSYHLI